MNSVSYSGAVRTALSVAVLSALVACGGGGGGSTAASPTVTLSGLAAKGLLKSAKVQAYKVNSDGSLTLLKEDVTDTNGSYSLAGIPAGVTVLVKISVVPGTTKIVDEATDTTVDAPSDFVIRAATVTQEGGTNTLQVTPFSEMAVTKALADTSSLTQAQKIEGANADVRSYLGYDVLTEQPEFSSGGTVPANRAALMLAAVSEVANSGSITGCATGTTAEKVNCVVKQMASSGTDDSDLADKIEAAKEAVSGPSGDYAPADPTSPTAAVPPAPAPQPTDIVAPDVRSTAITDAKALVASIRANAPYLGGSGTDTLDKRLHSVQDVISTAASPVGDSSLELYKSVVKAAIKLNSVDSSNFVAGPFEVGTDVGEWAYCTYFQGSTNTAATSEANTAQIGCRITYKVYHKGNDSVTWYAHQHAFRVVKPVSGSAYVVRTVTIEQKLNSDFTSDTSSDANTVYYSGTKDVPIAGTITLTLANGDVTAFAMAGDYAAGINTSIQGYSTKNTVTATLVPSVVTVNSVDLDRLSITGTFVASGGSKPTGTVQIADGSYLQTKFDVSGDVHSTETGFADRSARLILSASAGTASATGTLNVSGFKGSLDMPQVVRPSSVSFQGVIKQDSSTTLFDGTITATSTGFDEFYVNDPQTSDNFASVSVTFSGALYVPTRPLLNVSLTLASPTFEHYTLVGSYSQSGGPTVQVSGSGQAHTDANSSVTFTNTAGGISMTVLPNTTVAYLKKNDVVIGTFSGHSSRVEYADGSYEQF